MARDIAPGLLRCKWGFQSWAGHDGGAWKALIAEAEERRRDGRSNRVQIFGSDASARAVQVAELNAQRAGVPSLISVRQVPLSQVQPPPDVQPGLVLTNPPYGHRLGEKAATGELIAELGDVLRRRYLGWDAWIFVAHDMVKRLGLRPARRVPLFNGPLDCRALHLPISSQPVVGRPGWR